MFNKLFKQENLESKKLYASALTSARNEVFYTRYNVPDTFDGRFDLLLLHIFIILQRIKDKDNYQELSQDLFDVMFKDMDQTLREIGIGDVGIPKHMKKMMKAFNGRMHVYQDAISNDIDLNTAIARNLYAMAIDDRGLNKNSLESMSAFVLNNINTNKNTNDFIISESK